MLEEDGERVKVGVTPLSLFISLLKVEEVKEM